MKIFQNNFLLLVYQFGYKADLIIAQIYKII